MEKIMVKDSFYLTIKQKERLKKEAAKEGLKTSEMLRRIIDRYFEDKSK